MSTENSQLVAALVNTEGHILPSSIRSYASKVKEDIIKEFGQKYWDSLINESGLRLMYCRITIDHDRDYSDV